MQFFVSCYQISVGVDAPFIPILMRPLRLGCICEVGTSLYVSNCRVELTSGSWRSKAGHWFHSLTWIAGHLSLGLLVYLIPNMRHLELCIGLSALPFMFLWYLLPESPRWLLSKGRNEEAIAIIKKACKWNKMPASKLENLNFIHSIGEKSERGKLVLVF